MIYRFADYCLDTRGYELRRGEEVIAVEPQVFNLITFLVENRDRVVSKDDLIDAVWGGRIVSEAALSSRISAARQALGDSGERQAIIRTLPRRGLRFLPAVEAAGAGPPAPPLVAARADRQTVRYCTTADRVQLAYALSGSGPPLIKVANWLNHLTLDWESPIWGSLFHELAAYRRLLRYDSRGAGLSDWQVEDISFPAMTADLDAVIDAAKLPTPFALLGISQGAAIAIDYAVRHPERVSGLVLWGGFARGRKRRGNPDDAAQSEAFKTLMRQGWGKETSAFRQMFAALYLPDADDEKVRWWTDLQRISTSPENAVRLREAIDELDVSPLLERIRTPTLILHSAREEVAPLAEARFMAARIPGAEFVLLDSANHLVLEDEPAWRVAVDAIRAFLTHAG